MYRLTLHTRSPQYFFLLQRVISREMASDKKSIVRSSPQTSIGRLYDELSEGEDYQGE